MEYGYNEIGEYVTKELICEHSRSFFEKLEYGCYDGIFEFILFFFCCYVFIRTFVWLLSKVWG